MAKFPSMADRTWFAYLCLPLENGEPPSMASIEADVGLSYGTISKTVKGRKRFHEYDTMRKLARGLRTSPEWLKDEEGDGPVPPPGVVMVPRPGHSWGRYGDVSGWDQSVKMLLAEATADKRERVPPEAFLAGSAMAVYRAVDRVTPEIALAVAAYAWETSTRAEQIHYTTLYRRFETSRASTLRKKTR